MSSDPASVPDPRHVVLLSAARRAMEVHALPFAAAIVALLAQEALGQPVTDDEAEAALRAAGAVPVGPGVWSRPLPALDRIVRVLDGEADPALLREASEALAFGLARGVAPERWASPADFTLPVDLPGRRVVVGLTVARDARDRSALMLLEVAPDKTYRVLDAFTFERGRP